MESSRRPRATRHDPLDPSWPTFDQALGQRLKQVRLEDGKTAQEVAEHGRWTGIGWDRSAISRVESGKRSVSALEMFLLTLLYSRPAADLLPTEPCRLSEGVGSDPAALRASLTRPPREFYLPGLIKALREHGEETRTHHAEGQRLTDERRADVARFWPTVQDDDLLDAGTLGHIDEAESKVAKRLGVMVYDVRMGAQVLWRRSLVAERDARLGNDELPPRVRQARRGHVTRALTEELRPVVEGFVAQRATDDEADA